ncbi:FAD-binding domain-containing protein [Albidovulum sp.]|uniref:FAD-binding domain-containing protein n=1 Tax=Albidovulum sp. TaxID=1872424 RepID=UPI003FA05B6B
MDRGADVVARHAVVGEEAARERPGRFPDERLSRHAMARDMLAEDAASGLSDYLGRGEIARRRIWAAAMAARDAGVRGDEGFLSEPGWRDLAWHLLYHHPGLASESWREGRDRFPRRGDDADAERWRRSLTGASVVDAAMREMFVTGRMHNRARMIVASYRARRLLTDWRVGLGWFADCPSEWDPASNATGWQWVAGSGPDAAPYFRIFNPQTPAARFDPEGACRRTAPIPTG